MIIRYPVLDKRAEDLLAADLTRREGFYPVGANNFWHGGIHLKTTNPLVAVADGELVAYRINSKNLVIQTGGKEPLPFSTGFVLTRHVYETPRGTKIPFYALYMHLLPFGSYTQRQREHAPSFLVKHSITVNKAGKKIRAQGRGHDTPILRDTVEGEELELKKFAGLKITTGEDGKINNNKYFELAGDGETSGGWLYLDKDVTYARKLREEGSDRVICPGSKIRAGDILGYAGINYTEENIFHFEIFTDNVDFLSNPNKESWGPKYIQVPQGTVFHKRTQAIQNPVQIPAGTKMALVTEPGPHPGQWRHVGYTDTDKIERQGWVKRTDLGTYDPTAKMYTLKADLRYFADRYPECSHFDEPAGICSEDLTVPETTATEEDQLGRTWREVPGHGWYNEATIETKRLSDYDWPGFTCVDEKKDQYSEDGLCDVKAILDLIDTDHDHVIENNEIRQAYSNPRLIDKLRKVICCHPTEWDSGTDARLKKYDCLLQAPWNMNKDLHRAALEHIETFQFWEQVPGLPNPMKVWHFHPIAFLQHLKNLMGITEAQLSAIMPKVTKTNIDKFLLPLNETMNKYLIDSRLRQCHFLAQIAIESNSLNNTTEKYNGNEIVYFTNKYEDNNIADDLGNTEPGDGPRFRGRGLIQLTGRYNYTIYSEYINDISILQTDGSKKIATDSYLSTDVAGWFWKIKKINKSADKDDIVAVTRKVNGGETDLDGRVKFLVNSKNVFN